MISFRGKAQSLNITVDFRNKRLIGSTSLAVALLVPYSYKSVFQTAPPNDSSSSSNIAIALRCPGPDQCYITSVNVNGVPASFFHGHQETLEDRQSKNNGVYDLLTYGVSFHEKCRQVACAENFYVNIPCLALHKATLKVLKLKQDILTRQNSNSSKSEKHDFEASQLKFTIPLKISIGFTLMNIVPMNSVAYFTSYCLRPPGSLKLIHHDFFVACPDKTHALVWFPTLPACWQKPSADQKKSSAGRCFWSFEFTVPLGMTAIGPGTLVRSIKGESSVLLNDRVETFFYETKGPLFSLPPEEICLFVGYFSLCTQSISLSSTEETSASKMQDDKDKENSSIRKPNVLCVSLSGVKKKLLKPAFQTVSYVLQALHEIYGVNYPHSQLILLFFPFGDSSLRLGEGTFSLFSSCLYNTFPHPGLGKSFSVYGSTVVMDLELLHTGSENHPLVCRAEEILAEGVLSVLFGSVLSVYPHDMAKDWWLLIAFRRLAVDFFIQKAFGAPHLCALMWLRLDLFAKLVEAGYDIAPLSNAYIENEPQYPQAQQMDTKFSENTCGHQPGFCSSPFFVSSSWFNPCDIIVGLKAGLIFPSLQVLFTAFSTTDSRRSLLHEYDPACPRWSPPAGTFQSFLCGIVTRALKKGPGSFISTQEFLTRLERRLKTTFISSGVWRHLSSEACETFAENLPPQASPIIPPTVDTLDTSLYANIPSLDIGNFLETLKGFFDSWVYGVGCSSISMGFFLQLPKKSSLMSIESCRVHFDEAPLQPPTLIDPYTGVSDFYPSLLASRPLLEIFLEEANELENQQDQHSLLISSQHPVDTISHRDLFANHDIQSLFLECQFEMFPSFSPVELIIKDNGTGLGFGYVGRDTSPITDGLGTLYNVLETRLNSDWSTVDLDRRALLTSDTAPRNALLCSQAEARTLPLATPPDSPFWLTAAAAAVIIRDVVRHSAVLCCSSAFRSGVLSRRTLPDEKSRIWCEKHEDVDKLPRVFTPLSLGFGKYYTNVLTIHTCRDHDIVEDFYFFHQKELPTTFELRAFDDVKILNSVVKQNLSHLGREKAQSHLGNLDPQISYDKEGATRKFFGQFSFADELLLSSNASLHSCDILALFESSNVARRQLRQKDGLAGMKMVRKEKFKRLPILWMRIMASSRPIWLSRFSRYQSISMWEQQFMNDPFVTSQLEAALALGKIPFSASVVSCLCWALRHHHFHPLVRSFAARSLKRLHNEYPKSHASHCLSVLLNYVYLYHYRSRKAEPGSKKRQSKLSDEENEGKSTPIISQTPKKTPSESCSVHKEDNDVSSFFPEKTSQLPSKSNKFFHLFPSNSPFWMTSEMMFFKDMLTAIAQLRDPDGNTTYEAIDTLTQLLMYHATNIRTDEQDNADYYIAHLISTLKYIRLPFQGCAVAIEDVAIPELCQLLTSFRFPQAERLKRVQQTWLRWKEDEMDSYAESLFLHVWRYYRLDHCLHSRHHVMTCSCLDVFSRNAILRDLLRLKLCDEAKHDFQLLSFLPLNFLPLIIQAFEWCEIRLPSHEVLDILFNNGYIPNSVLVPYQVDLVNHLKGCWGENSLPSLMLAGLVEIVYSIREHYYHYQDEHVERAALKALFYCTAAGSMEPPLIFTTKYSRVSLCNLQSVEDLLGLLQETCFTQFPSSALHAQAFLLLARQWITQGSSLLSSDFQHISCTVRNLPELGVNTMPNIQSLQYISRYLFCARWTSAEESDGLQRSGISLLNAVMLACRLDEVLTVADSTNLLGSVWDIFNEVLEDLLQDAPLVFTCYCIKPCRGLDEDLNYNVETTSECNQPILPPLKEIFPTQTLRPSQLRKKKHQWREDIEKISSPYCSQQEAYHVDCVSPSRESNVDFIESSLSGLPEVQNELETPFRNQVLETAEANDWNTQWTVPDNQEHVSQNVDGSESVSSFTHLNSLISCELEEVQQENFSWNQQLGKSPTEASDDNQFVDSHHFVENSYSIDYFQQESLDLKEMELSDTLFIEDGGLMDSDTTLKFPSDDLHVDHIFDDFDQPKPDLPIELPPEDFGGRTCNDDFSLAFDETSIPAPPTSPSVLCAKVLSEYLFSRIFYYPVLLQKRLTGVKKVFYFLFGFGLPQCLALSHESPQTPDPFYVDTFNGCLKHGRYLKKLCLFQKRYLEDDSPEVPDWQTLAMEIIEVLISMPLAAPFLDEVNYKEAPTYRLVVKEPMWLRRIQEKLQSQAYSTYQDWKNDLFLIFRNCRTFNFPESKIVQDCEALQAVVYSLLKLTEKLLSRSVSVKPMP